MRQHRLRFRDKNHKIQKSGERFTICRGHDLGIATAPMKENEDRARAVACDKPSPEASLNCCHGTAPSEPAKTMGTTFGLGCC